MRWYEYIFKPFGTLIRGVTTVIDKSLTFVGDVFGGGSTVVKGATTAVSDICGDVANVTNGVGNAVNSVGSNLPLYLVGGAGLAVVGILALRGGGDGGSASDNQQASPAPKELGYDTESSGDASVQPTSSTDVEMEI